MFAGVVCFKEEFALYMRYTRHLDFFETPDYNYLRKLFADVMTRNGWDYDWVFDWTNRIQVYTIGLKGDEIYLILLLFYICEM